jgi:hypothetical protein
VVASAEAAQMERATKEHLHAFLISVSLVLSELEAVKRPGDGTRRERTLERPAWRPRDEGGRVLRR